MRYDQKEITNASRATVKVPAAGPNRRTDVKTNVSETETATGSEGRLTVADPLTRVSRAMIIHVQPMLCRKSCTKDWITMKEPTAPTSAR